jgi:large subunit ribosomal protein L16
MSLMPKRVMYRKSQRGRIRGCATRGNYVAFGDYGIMALDQAWVNARQIEAARIVMSRSLGTEGRYWIRIFPHKAVTARPAETRMGKGKGEIAFWTAVVKPGTVLFEIGGVPEHMARDIFRRQAAKLPCRVKLVKRRAAI